MGQRKHNPTAIAAKNGELPPKQRGIRQNIVNSDIHPIAM